jgi:predicted nuclease of predicted toxin-antitoxin system
VTALSALGLTWIRAPAEGLAGHSDPDVWRATQTAERFLITQDLDFSDLRAFAPGTHHGSDSRTQDREGRVSRRLELRH